MRRASNNLRRDIQAFRARLREHQDFLQKATVTTEDLLALAGLLEREFARVDRKTQKKRS
jgi:hypothetical protein